MVYRQKSSRIPSDPVLSDSFRLSEIVGNRRIRLSETIGSSIRQLPIGILYQGIQQLPTGSYRKLSDSCRKLSDCLGFPVGSDGIRQSDCSSWVIATFFNGGRTGFSTGDPSRLMKELALVRPSSFGGPPSIWNKIYTEFKTALSLISFSHSLEVIETEEQNLLQQFSKLIPNRCKTISISGAKVSPVILNFMCRKSTYTCSIRNCLR